jgi:hypothetical protein
MSIFAKLRNKVRNHLFFKQLFAYYIIPSGLFDKWLMSIEPTDEWQERTKMVLACPDNVRIDRVEDAGEVQDGYQIMHNGLKIMLGSYYGPEVSHMLLKNRGVHEPQEELVFKHVLDDLKKRDKDSYTMIELGSFWAFYSMWFKKELKNSVNYMVEPELFNLGCGKKNFRKNHFDGTFINAYVGNCKKQQGSYNYVSVDSLVSDYSIPFIDIVHSDIQGYEYEMLHGAADTIRENKIGYFFISTHSNKVHDDCLVFLVTHSFEIIASANLDESYSFDGLIVARNMSYPGINKVDISLYNPTFNS